MHRGTNPHQKGQIQAFEAIHDSDLFDRGFTTTGQTRTKLESPFNVECPLFARLTSTAEYGFSTRGNPRKSEQKPQRPLKTKGFMVFMMPTNSNQQLIFPLQMLIKAPWGKRQ
jgi:hypothetical protein